MEKTLVMEATLMVAQKRILWISDQSVVPPYSPQSMLLKIHWKRISAWARWSEETLYFLAMESKN